MNYVEKERFEKIRATFRLNFAITRLYADYLNNHPDCITRELVELIREGSDMTREEALVGILTELFGIDFDRSIEDRRLIRDYLTPSVRMMDPERYTQNPYYVNIKIPSVKVGDWELKTESYKPYRAVIAGDMEIFPDLREVPPLGFFEEEFFFPAVLEGGNEWMTLTPVDLDTCEEAIEAARGRVVTFGLGLGYYAYMVSEKTEVESVTVVEKSPDVIKLFKEYILPQFKHGDKVRIVEADAFEYAERIMPSEGFDLAFVDTWRDASDGAPMYEKMKRLEPLSAGTKFLYWIENFLISRCRAIKYGEICDMIDADDANAPKTCAEAVEMLKNPLGM
ncbi:MAG: hypothetical protein IKL79_05885 [Clostridia bacterium]|nr:hypothetical protein [Clostridia bacterium]